MSKRAKLEVVDGSSRWAEVEKQANALRRARTRLTNLKKKKLILTSDLLKLVKELAADLGVSFED